jgi:hypothetical protein
VAFEIVTIAVCVVSAAIAAVLLVRGLKVYDEIGRLGSLAMTHDEEPNAATREQVREEIREMLDALSQARGTRGERLSAAELLDLLDARQSNPPKSH